jgi:hypothetical protein
MPGWPVQPRSQRPQLEASAAANYFWISGTTVPQSTKFKVRRARRAISGCTRRQGLSIGSARFRQYLEVQRTPIAVHVQ